MSFDSISFSVPREQWLTGSFLSIAARRSPQDATSVETGRYFFFWARNALYHALHALGIPRNARVLLPAYLCRAAAEPFAAYGLDCDYYDLRPDCTPDFCEIEAKIRPETRAVLAAHYFGFPLKTWEFSDLCRRRNLLLFEDCAHVLRTEDHGKMLGTFGHASVFSYRKFLPIFDGAELLLSGAKQIDRALDRPLFNARAARFIASQAINSSSGLAARILMRGIGTARKLRKTKSTKTAEAALTQESVDNNSAAFDPALANHPMTGPSRWVLRHSNVFAIAERRRANFNFLQERFLYASGVKPLFNQLPQGVCPWIYPLFIDGVPNAHLLLRDAGIPAVTWGGVRVENISGREFPGANFLYENLVFLPVHQNLSDGHLQSIVNAVRRVGLETRKRELQKNR